MNLFGYLKDQKLKKLLNISKNGFLQSDLRFLLPFQNFTHLPTSVYKQGCGSASLSCVSGSSADPDLDLDPAPHHIDGNPCYYQSVDPSRIHLEPPGLHCERHGSPLLCFEPLNLLNTAYKSVTLTLAAQRCGTMMIFKIYFTVLDTTVWLKDSDLLFSPVHFFMLFAGGVLCVKFCGVQNVLLSHAVCVSTA